MKKKYVLCPVCQTKIEATSDIGLVCYLCNCLINLNARALNYFNEGGQPLPSKEKSLLRIKDAELRFKLISNKISKDTTTFVDIGCGSGEMLSVAKKYFKNIIGYEHCPILYKYVSNLGYKVFNNNFKANHLNSLDIKKNENILITLNHVLEHNENSIEMIKKIIHDISNNIYLYIEVPLYTGISFQRKKYSWKLWYEQHLALYSKETLKYISNEIDAKILTIGNRIFYAENLMYKRNLFLSVINPFSIISSLLKMKKGNTLYDNFLKDFGYVLLEIKNK